MTWYPVPTGLDAPEGVVGRHPRAQPGPSTSLWIQEGCFQVAPPRLALAGRDERRGNCSSNHGSGIGPGVAQPWQQLDGCLRK